MCKQVRKVQHLQERLDDKKAASPPDSPASDQTASKASTKREADDEQVKELKQQLQFNQVASAGWKRAAEQATEGGAKWKAQALQWKKQADINLLKAHKAVTSLELPEFPVSHPPYMTGCRLLSDSHPVYHPSHAQISPLLRSSAF